MDKARHGEIAEVTRDWASAALVSLGDAGHCQITADTRTVGLIGHTGPGDDEPSSGIEHYTITLTLYLPEVAGDVGVYSGRIVGALEDASHGRASVTGGRTARIIMRAGEGDDHPVKTPDAPGDLPWALTVRIGVSVV